VVNVKLKDGRAFSERVDKGPWEPGTSPGWDDLVGKFRANAEMSLSKGAVDRAIDMVSRLEALDDLAELMQVVGRK
jgi:hypothetical protein